MITKRDIKSFSWAPDHADFRWFGVLTLEPDETPNLELVVERRDPIIDRRPVGPGRASFDSTLLRQHAEFQKRVIGEELLHLRFPKHGKLFKTMLAAHLKRKI